MKKVNRTKSKPRKLIKSRSTRHRNARRINKTMNRNMNRNRTRTRTRNRNMTKNRTRNRTRHKTRQRTRQRTRNRTRNKYQDGGFELSEWIDIGELKGDMKHRSTIKRVYEEVRKKIKGFDKPDKNGDCHKVHQEINSTFKRARGWSRQRTKTMKEKIIKGLLYIKKCMDEIQDKWIIGKLIEIECFNEDLSQKKRADDRPSLFFTYEPPSKEVQRGALRELHERLLQQTPATSGKTPSELKGELLKITQRLDEPEPVTEPLPEHEDMPGVKKVKDGKSKKKDISEGMSEGISEVKKAKGGKLKTRYLKKIGNDIIWHENRELVRMWTQDMLDRGEKPTQWFGKNAKGPFTLTKVTKVKNSVFHKLHLIDEKGVKTDVSFDFGAKIPEWIDEYLHDSVVEGAMGVEPSVKDVFDQELKNPSKISLGSWDGTLVPSQPEPKPQPEPVSETESDTGDDELLKRGVSNPRGRDSPKPEIKNESNDGFIFKGVMLMSRPSDMVGGGEKRFFVVDNDCKISWNRERLWRSDSRPKPPRRLVQVKKVPQERRGGGDKLIIYIEGGLNALKDRAKLYGISDGDIKAAEKSGRDKTSEEDEKLKEAKKAVIELILKKFEILEKPNTSGKKRDKKRYKRERDTLEYELNEMETPETITVRNDDDFPKKGEDEVKNLWEALTTHAPCGSNEGTTDSGEQFMRFTYGTTSFL